MIFYKKYLKDIKNETKLKLILFILINKNKIEYNLKLFINIKYKEYGY